MKEYVVGLRLRINLEDNAPSPEEWDWLTLLDLGPYENVTVVYTERTGKGTA